MSSGHSPRLGGTIFVWGGTSSHLGGHGPGMPPPGAGSEPVSYLPYDIVPGSCAQILGLLLVFTYIWQEDVAKIVKVPGASRNVNPALE